LLRGLSERKATGQQEEVEPSAHAAEPSKTILAGASDWSRRSRNGKHLFTVRLPSAKICHEKAARRWSDLLLEGISRSAIRAGRSAL